MPRIDLSENESIDGALRRLKKKMERALKQIQSGKFARGWIRETKAGKKRYAKLLAAAARHPIEKIGERLRRPK